MGEEEKISERFGNNIQKNGKNDSPNQNDLKLDQDARNNSQIWQQDKRKNEDPMRNGQEMRKIKLAKFWVVGIEKYNRGYTHRSEMVVTLTTIKRLS